MVHEEVWRLEERLWTGAVQEVAETLEPDAVMAFPAPVGLLAGRVILDSLKGGPRWRSVDMTERLVGHADREMMVLAYRAVGHREGQPDYRAYCTSTWRHDAYGWRLAQHQQTPIS